MTAYFYGDEASSDQWEERDTRARLGLHNDGGTGAPDPISIESLADETSSDRRDDTAWNWSEA